MSKLSITFQFDSEAEAQAFLSKLTKPAVVEVAVEKQVRTRRTAEKNHATLQTSEQQATQPQPPIMMAEAKAPPPEPTPTLTPPPAPKVSVGSPTQEDVRSALRTVFNGKGATAATELLKKFNATSVSSVMPEQYADFIKACQ